MRVQIGSAVLGVLILLALGGWSLASWEADRPPADAGRLTAASTPAPAGTGSSGGTAGGAARVGRPAGTDGSSAAPPQVGSHAAKLSDLVAAADRAPSALSIPSIGAAAPVVGVGTDPATGELTVPHNAKTVVWWRAGARPGDPAGTTVLAAHVDWNGAEGVFFHLDRLAIGATVTVADQTGAPHRYRVVTRTRVAKPALAGVDLFRTGGQARLALVTCGGAFDAATHSYKDNVVILAVPL